MYCKTNSPLLQNTADKYKDKIAEVLKYTCLSPSSYYYKKKTGKKGRKSSSVTVTAGEMVDNTVLQQYDNVLYYTRNVLLRVIILPLFINKWR